MDHVSKGKEFFDDLAMRIAQDYEALSNVHQSIFTPLKTTIQDSFIVSYNAVPPKQLYEIDEALKESTKNETGINLILKIYDHFYHLYLSDLGHYFRNLYHVVRFAERSNLSNDQKRKFIKILRAQLSNYEILLLAINGLHRKGGKFYRLIEQYELLKNLDNEDFVPKSYVTRIMDKNAFAQAYPHLGKIWNLEGIEQRGFLYWIKPVFWK